MGGCLVECQLEQGCSSPLPPSARSRARALDGPRVLGILVCAIPFLPIFDEVLVDRREFLAATAVAAVSPMPALDTLAQPTTRQYIELRRYHLLPGTKQRAFSTFVGDVAIPAMNRAGVDRGGAF